MGRLSNLSTFTSLQVRDYRLLWMGQISTSMGQWMDQVSRGWLIYHITGSPLQLGLATAIRGLPLLFFGVIAGAVADRSGRKLQLIIAQGTNALLNVILATLVLTGQVHPWHIYVTGFLAGTVQAFQQPARQTLIGDIVGNKRLLNALALNSAALNISRAIGPAIAGTLIAFVGAQGSYYAQAGLYLFATVWTIQIRIPDRSSEAMRRMREPFFASIKSGFQYVGGNRNIRTLMLLALVPLTLAMPYTSLMPIFAKDVLHGGPRLQGLLLTCVGLGALAGALVVASIRRENGYGWPVVMGAVAFGLGLVGFSLSRWAGLTALFGVIVGVFSVTYQTQNQTLLQLSAPRHIRGRVMSIYLLNRGLVPIGTLGAGALAAWMGGPKALLIMSASSVCAVGLVILTHPQFLRARVPLSDQATEEAESGPGSPRRRAMASPDG
ncbi:MAG: MFS transporter [Dehalococcoidia bacterium]|nr:MFS transporter [Dehalococcoidia bacterium]